MRETGNDILRIYDKPVRTLGKYTIPAGRRKGNAISEMENKTILDYETVDIDLDTKELIIIDQTKLPGKTEIVRISDAQDIWDAIYLLKVRGAPAIGVAAAFGLYILACGTESDDYEGFRIELERKKEFLNSSRPTAVNLSWALNRMMQVADKTAESSIQSRSKNGQIQPNNGQNEQSDRNDPSVSERSKISVVLEALKNEALLIKQEDIEVCRAIGENGLTLVKKGDGILTHCNAGQLATCRYGTATAPIYLGQERGYDLRVYADETRPLLQGARLTAYELSSAGVDVTLLCDNMCASVMQKGLINAVFVGCDRVAANGDTANKIGTSVVATVAKHYNVPVYICAPTSTIDLNTPTGAEIRIEQRPAEEVTEMWYKERMAPEGIKVYNPAFDVTDHSLIAGIVTEHGIAYEPYTDSLKKMVEARGKDEICLEKTKRQ